MTTTATANTSKADSPTQAPRTRSWFWRYWGGSTVSRFGTAVTTIALPLTAIGVAHADDFEVGEVTAAGFAGWVAIGLPAGVLVGRLPLRETQIAMDLVRAAALLTIPLAWWFGTVTVAQLIGVALVVGLASVIFDVGNSTMLPFLVGKQELTARNSLMSGTEAVTQLAGPSLGGALVQTVGAATSIAADVVSYLISAFLLRNVPRPPRSVPDKTAGTSIRASIRAGWNFVVHHRVMRSCMLIATAMNFVCGALTALIPVFLVRGLGLSAAAVGVLIAAEGVGSLLGASLTPRLTQRFGSGRTVLVVSLAFPATIALLPLTRSGWSEILFAVGNVAFAITVVVASIQFRTHRHVETPTELLPRVMATVRFVSWGVNPLGALAAGAVATWLGPRDALWGTCVAALAVPLIVLAGPIRSRRELAGA